MTPSLKQLIEPGKAFGKLTVTRLANKTSHGARWACLCECGKSVEVYGSHLRSGNTRSCGCLLMQYMTTQKNRLTHGAAVNGKQSPLYIRFRSMHERCYNPTCKQFSYYGGRGIKICAEWYKNFPAFKNWSEKSGYRRELFIDRILNDGDYSPSNCRFVTIRESTNNRRNTVFVIDNGEQIPITDFARKYGVDYRVLYSRIKRGATPSEALSALKPFAS